jgi:cytosine/adenosine deaminase-related metal-dependent hydrolase
VEQLLRPYGLVIDGRLELGLEVVVFNGVIEEVRPHTGIPEPYVISPAFVNAHSHLEYRGLLGKLQAAEYWPWIREITLAKREQSQDEVLADCVLAAQENRETGVAFIAEHSDRPYAGQALISAELDGVIFQEVITRFDSNDRLKIAMDMAERQRHESGGRIQTHLAAHAYQTVDEETLRWFGNSGQPFSMHVAETDLEDQLTLSGTGQIAETLDSLGVSCKPTGKRLIASLDDLGVLRPGAHFVHCCALTHEEVELLATRRVSVAHCPRSNVRLNCPTAPVREMVDAGVLVGLGLDSAASSGPIDMFDEMRCAMQVSLERGRPVSAEEVWSMATTLGANSLRFAAPDLADWQIAVGSGCPMIRIHISDALTTDDLIDGGGPDLIEGIQ